MGFGWSKDERADAEKNEFHKLLQECQGLTKDLVRDVVDLLRSLDLMLPTTQTLKDNLTRSVGKLDHSTTEEIFHLEKCQRAALQLYLATEGIQLCQKQGTMNTLDKLLQFIKKLVQREVECKPGSFGEDLLEGYMKGTETAKTIEEMHPDVSETQKSDHKKKKKSDLIKDITHIEKANSELKQKVIHLEKKVSSFYPEKKILNENIQKLERELEFRFAEKKFKDLPNDLDNTCVLEDQLKQLSSKLIKAEEGTTVLNEKIDLLNEENGRLTSQLISVDIDKANLETELKQMTKLEREKETIVIEMDNDKRRDKELKLTEEIGDLKQKIQDTETRITTSIEERKRLEEDTHILEEKRDEETQKIMQLEFKLTQKSEEHKEICEQKDESIKELNEMKTKLNAMKKEREEENAEFMKTLQKANDNFDSAMDKLEREKDDIKNERAEEKKRDEELRTKLTEEIGDFKQKIQDTETRIKTSIEERKRIKEENRILKKERDEEAQKVMQIEIKLIQKSEEHKEKCIQRDVKVKELNEMEMKMKAIVKEREEENTVLIQTFQKANDNFDSVMVKLEREKDEIRKVRTNEKKRDDELRIKLTEEIGDLKQKIQDTETRTKTSIEECERLQEEKRILEEKRDEEAQKVLQLEIKLTQKSEEHKEICGQKDEKVKELNEMEMKLKAIIKEREEENAGLIKTLQKANDKFENAMVKLEREKDNIKQERSNGKKRDDELRIELTEEIGDLKQKIQDTETRTKTSIEECERLQEEKRILEEKRDEEAQKVLQLEIKLTQKSEEHKEICGQKDEKVKELNKMGMKLNAIIKEREEENAGLIKTLQKANDNFDNAMVKLEREKDNIKQERANEKKRDDELRIKLTEEIGDLKQKVQDTETRTKTSIEECERLQEEKRILEEKRDEEVQKVLQLEIKLTQKSEEHKEICRQKDEKVKELNEMEMKLKAIVKEREEENTVLIQTFQKANDNFDSVMVKLEREKDEIRKVRTNEKKRDDELRIKLTEEIGDLKQKIQDTETRTKTSIEECERLQEEKLILEEKRDEEVHKVLQLEIKLTQKSEEHKEICGQKDEKVKELNEMEMKLNAIIKEREEENAGLIKTLQKANDNFDNAMVKLEREKDNIKQERANEKKRDDELRIKVTKEIGDLKQKIQDTETRTTTLIEERERLKEENRTLQKEMDEGAQRIRCLETELKQKSYDYKVSNEQKDGKIKDLVSTQIKLQENLTEKEGEHAQLSKTLQNANDNFDTLMKKFDTEKEKLVGEWNEETTQKEELKIQLANTIDNCKQQLQQKEMKICDLTVVQNKMKSKEMEYQSCLQGKEQTINELDNLNKTMQKQQLQDKEDYDNKKTSLENENQRVQRQLDMLRGDLKAKSESENNLLKETEVLTADLLDKKGHIERINNKYENTKLQLTKEISALTEAQLKDKNRMETRERTLVSELQNVRSTNKTLNDQICKEQHACKENENLITGLKEQMTHIEEEKTKLRKRLTKIAQDLENCTAENETMKNELEKIKSRKVIQIQMYSQSGVGLLSSVEDELKCVLKSTMDVEEGVDVDIISCAKASDIQPEIPLLILCIQASRLGTAVASTVQGLTLTPKMAVLIFHHKDVHALPNQASERVLTGQELRNLGGIFDLAFLSGKGIYTCEMNRSNFVSLINFIKREGKKRLREDL